MEFLDAIGPGTERALASRGIVADLVPQRFIAEALLDVFPAPSTSEARVLVVRPEVARDALPDGLAALGYNVDLLATYRTVRGIPTAIDLDRVRTGEVDVVTFTSSSTVSNFVEVVGPTRCRSKYRERYPGCRA